jgi:FemAB family protein
MKIEKKLFEIIYSYFPDADIDINKWKGILKISNSNLSTFHLLNTIKYYVSYFSDNDSINLSMILYYDKQEIGIMPLMVHKNKNNEWVLSSNGEEIVEPIFKKNLADKVRKKIETKILDLIFDLSKELKINKCQFVNIEFFKLSKWYTKLLELAEETFTSHHLMVDLSLSIEEIRLQFRNRYKTLVNKGFKEWKIQVHEKVTSEQFDNFRLLHKSVSGRSTRPIESWSIQKQSVNSNESFIVTVSDKKDLLVGFGLFVYSDHIGSYAVGAYNRELFSKPLGHAVQMKAIEMFKSKGLHWYEIGNKHLIIDKVPPTEKELSISHFKEGFATDVLARQHLVINMTS